MVSAVPTKYLIELIGDTPVSVLSWMPGTQAGKLGDLDVPDRLPVDLPQRHPKW